MQTFLDADDDRSLNAIGHQNPIAQPATACQIEFRLIQLSFANPTAKRLGIAADLARDRRDRGPLRAVLGLVIKHHPKARSRTSGENLWLVCFVMAPTFSEVGAFENPGAVQFRCPA